MYISDLRLANYNYTNYSLKNAINGKSLENVRCKLTKCYIYIIFFASILLHFMTIWKRIRQGYKNLIYTSNIPLASETAHVPETR